MTALERSMEYDRAHAEMQKVRMTVGAMRTAAEDNARMNNEPRPTYYDVIMDDLFALQAKYRTLSDKEYETHKATHEPSEEGILNLCNAVVLSAIQDYEEALSSGRRGAGGVIRSIRRFAQTEAGHFTTADVPAILTRIDHAYPKFKKIAIANLDGIKKETKRMRENSLGGDSFYGRRSNPYRCPMCGGGLWYSNGREKRVRCSSCFLSVRTDLEKETI